MKNLVGHNSLNDLGFVKIGCLFDFYASSLLGKELSFEDTSQFLSMIMSFGYINIVIEGIAS